MPRQPWLMDVIADEFRGVKGFRVDAYPGWETRGRPVFEPEGVMDHHTGAGAYNNLLRYMAVGPVHPPLCNYATSRPNRGVVRVTVVAAGRANHAGVGELPWRRGQGSTGNFRTFGAEHQNDGRQPWPSQQVEAIRRVDAALLKAMGRDTAYMLDHKTYAPTRKVDRHSTDVASERRAVAKLMQPAPTDPWEEFMSELTDSQKNTLIEFADAIDEFDTNARSFVFQFLKFNREERGKLVDFLEAIDYMDSSPRGQGRAMSALWREAGARGWERDIDKFRENRVYTEDELST